MDFTGNHKFKRSTKHCFYFGRYRYLSNATQSNIMENASLPQSMRIDTHDENKSIHTRQLVLYLFCSVIGIS